MDNINFWDEIKYFYIKKRYTLTPDMSICITLTKWLAQDKDNLPSLKQLTPFLFYLSPETYIKILWLLIPKKQNAPYLKYPSKQKIKELDETLIKIKQVLGWSNRELRYHMKLIDKIILPEKKRWNELLGIK